MKTYKEFYAELPKMDRAIDWALLLFIIVVLSIIITAPNIMISPHSPNPLKKEKIDTWKSTILSSFVEGEGYQPLNAKLAQVTNKEFIHTETTLKPIDSEQGIFGIAEYKLGGTPSVVCFETHLDEVKIISIDTLKKFTHCAF